MAPLLDELRFFAGAARILEGRSAGEYLRDHTSWVRREPIGVCAQVAPWNYPMVMAVWKFAPAIAAGNTVVLKPSDTTPVTTLLLAEIAAEFLPPGVLNVVCGDRDTGRALIAHPTPELVSITGSTRAGMEVAAAAAADLKRVHLELGGKAPVVVFDDVDIARPPPASPGAGYFNAGQDCTAAARVLVQRAGSPPTSPPPWPRPRGPPGSAGRTTPDAVLRAGQQPRPAGPGAGVPGPHARPRQVVTGGQPDRRPRLLPGADRGERTAADTTRWSRTRCSARSSPCSSSPTRTQAVRWANDVRYGLSASVWTRDHGRAMRMSRRLDFGAVWINTHIPFVSEMPHGGFGHSGYGKDLSMYGFEEYTRIKHVMSYVG